MKEHSYPVIALFVDQEQDELVLSLLKEGEVQLPDRAGMRRLFRLSFSKLEQDPEAREILTAAILASITHLGKTTLGYGGYKNLSGIASKRLDAEVKRGLERGDPKWQFYVAWDYVKASTDQADPAQLDIAEDYFRKAAAGGYDVAVDFLERGWPQIRAERLSAIQFKRKDRSSD